MPLTPPPPPLGDVYLKVRGYRDRGEYLEEWRRRWREIEIERINKASKSCNKFHPLRIGSIHRDLCLIVSLISGFTFITLAREEGRALFFRGVQFIKSVP